jgi:hypothetical protein
MDPFELHVVFPDIAIASWRPYLAKLHEDVVELVRHSLRGQTSLLIV